MKGYIKNNKDLKITNLDQLPKGLRCPFLEVTKSPIENEYIAVRWHRVIDDPDDIEGYLVTMY